MTEHDPDEAHTLARMTAPALSSLFVVLLMLLWGVWAKAGFLAALGLGWLFERALARIGASRGE